MVVAHLLSACAKAFGDHPIMQSSCADRAMVWRHESKACWVVSGAEGNFMPLYSTFRRGTRLDRTLDLTRDCARHSM